ncbi:phosphoenolpyruvate carboxylase, partial [Candidatus Woesearchaeota archaeon]|nr:phosphoenolpyruvate carboxylase [Candidatus Woesearchaeota archaeon]
EPLINRIAPYVPSRRKRKLHIGLFGYSRNVSGLKLPRAITFCASLYSYGLPPEMLGLNALTGNELDYVRDIYSNFGNDLKDAMQYLNKKNLRIFPKEIADAAEKVKGMLDFEAEPKHEKITSIIVENLEKNEPRLLTENITRAGFVRGFLG